MAGPPLSIDNKKFIPIVILAKGNPNIGKSTLVQALGHNKYSKVIFLDKYCYEFFNVKDPKFNLFKQLQTITDDTSQQLSCYITENIKTFPRHEIYLYEGYILSIKNIYNDIVSFYKKQNYKVWTIEKV